VPLATAFYAGGPGVDVRALARSPELQGSLAEAARRGCALFLDTCADWVPDTDVGRVRSSFALEAVASAGRCGSWHGEGGEVVLYRMRPRS
jgi:hypothetical protein